MEDLIWLFPIIFIFHDFEEIIGFNRWLTINEGLIKLKAPRFYDIYLNFSTEGFTLAVFEEFILCLLICILCLIYKNKIVYSIWIGAFMGCTFHFIIHIIQSIYLKIYIPSLITSIICLPISIYILKISFYYIKPINENIIFLLIGFLLIFLNFFFAQKLIPWYTKKYNQNL